MEPMCAAEILSATLLNPEETGMVEVVDVVEEHGGAYHPCLSSRHQEILTVSLTLPFET